MVNNLPYPTIHESTCPICGWESLRYYEAQIDKLWNGSGYTLVRVDYDVCEGCGTVFQNPRPTDEWIDEYYSNGTYRRTIQNGSDEVTQRVIKEQTNRAKYIMDYVKSWSKKPKTVLDVGSSTGILAFGFMAELECEVEGVEPPGIFHNWSMEQNEKLTVYDDISDVAGHYDLLTCIHTLEHISDPVWALKRFSELADTVLIEVPDLRNNSILRLCHLYAWTPISLIDTMQVAGLEGKMGKIHGNGGLDDETPQNILVVGR